MTAPNRPASCWVATARSLLFVPGTRPDRFEKARESGADGIVLDLEDAVPDGRKGSARDSVASWCRASSGADVVRINAAGSPWREDDLASLRGGPATVMVPKVETAHDVVSAVDALPAGSAVIACIETARGVLNLSEICSATSALVRLAFGNGDLSTDLGVSPDNKLALQYARSVLVLESRAHRLAAPLDGVTLGIADRAALEDDSAHAAELGFGGRMCIHPTQVDTVNKSFGPSLRQIEWAQKVVDAAAGDVASTVVDGGFVDKPIVERAQAILRSTRHG